MGYRDDEVLPDRISAYRVDRLRAVGIGGAVAGEVERLRSGGAQGFWIHVDADVLDPSVMPAVDTPEAGGLDPSELVEILRGLLASGLALGLQLCIYDPDLDPNGRCARCLVEILTDAFASRA